VRVTGALTGAVLLVLLDMVKTSELLLDLSEGREANTDAVRVLARLGSGVSDRASAPGRTALLMWLIDRSSRLPRRPRLRPTSGEAGD
jgi:hypothetical protein